MMFIDHDRRTIKPRLWCMFTVIFAVMGVVALEGPNVCMVKQKYNITRLVKYRAPMSVRTYEWCFSMPPRCSKWNTEMRDLTRRETEERTAEVAVCCPGYKMQDVSCVPICPNGKTGPGCSEECPDNKWGPNCIHDCQKCKNGFCSPLTGECQCLDGWQGESCDTSMPATTSTTTLEELLTTLTNQPTSPNTIPRAAISTTITSKFTTPITRILPSKTTTEYITRPPTTSTVTTLRTPSTLLTSTTAAATKPDEESSIISTEPFKVVKTTDAYTEIPVIPFNRNNITTTTMNTKTNLKPVEEVTQINFMKPGKTEVPIEIMTESAIKTVQVSDEKQKPLDSITTTEVPKFTTPLITKETTLNIDNNKKDTTVRIFPTTVKFKPKEIWIRPTQKGESPIIEAKVKSTHESPRYRSANNNKDSTPTNTTPKTIIVSIIPTSVSYSTFKKMALTTASIASQRNMTSKANKTKHEFTKPMPIATTSMPQTISTTKKYINNTSLYNVTTIGPTLPTIATTHKPSTSVTQRVSTTTATAILITNSMKNATEFLINKTNSMVDINATTSLTSVTSSTNARTPKQNDTSTKTYNVSSTPITIEKANNTAVAESRNRTNTPILHRTNKPKDKITQKVKETNLVSRVNDTTIVTPQVKVTERVTTLETQKEKLYTKVTRKVFKKTNVTKPLTISSTDEPTDDEEFHILTEPEHITAVMGDKGADRSSVDLVPVISIAGGVMMSVITVAVIIVMIERCKKPRYDDVRKINDIRMQVMIDNNDVPPPYVRSIFHTPLPDPPTSEKCHYQPISTLDRNLKQFMRPVVVQTISPIMLENFRGILECHYDHLPRRSHDFGTLQRRCSIAPSMNDCGELRHHRASVTESDIEALKCEAKCDMIDPTSEPLYAEIPCWRPPSEHAVEIMNLNGEAVTEL